MKRMILPAFLMAAVLAFSLAGCSQAQNITEDSLKGVWKLDSGSQVGFDAYINFGDDKVVEMILADSWLDGTYSISGTTCTLTFNSMYEEETTQGSSSSSSQSAESGNTGKITMANNKITLGSDNGSKLVFSKDNSEEAKQMFSFDMSGMEGVNMGEGVDESQYVEEAIEDISPVTVADDDKFTITVTGKGTDYTGDPCYRIKVANKTDKAVYMMPEDTFKVNGKSVEAGFGEELEAGANMDTEMYFAQDELGGGLDQLTAVDGTIVVIDDKTDDELAKYTFHMD